MIIEISKVPVSGGLYEGELPGTILDLEGNSRVRVESPISCRFLVQKVSGELVVQGRVRTRVGLECRRCTGFFSTTVEDSSFLRAYDAPEGTETVDVTADIREAILLTLPSFPLCSAECRGLCAQCGKNLNQGPCACRPPDADAGRWTALDKLSDL